MPGQKGWEKFLENEELRIQWAKENCEAMGVQKTDDEIKAMVNDPQKIETYKLARKITDREEQCKALADKYKADGVYEEVDPSLSRNYAFMLDLSGTKEADKKNIEFLKKISTPEGAIEVANQYANDCYNFDITKIMVKNPAEAIKAYEENFQDVHKMFVLNSMTANGSANQNPELSQFTMSITSLIEEAVNMRTMVSKCASNYYLTIPESHFEGPTGAQNVIMSQMSLNDIAQDRLNKQDPGTEYAFGVPEKHYQTYFAAAIDEKTGDKEVFYDNIEKLKNKGVAFDKDFIKNYKCFDKDGKQKPLGAALNSKNFDDFSFVEYTPQEKEFIKENCKKAVISRAEVVEKDNAGILETLNYVEDEKVNKAKGTRSTNRINAIKSTLNQLFGDKDTPREVPQISDSARNIVAYGLVKGLDEKHASRSGLWKFFHPFQNRAEANAVNELKNMLKEKCEVRQETFDHNYQSAETFKVNENGKYSFEKGKEPIKITTRKEGDIPESIKLAKLRNNLGKLTNMEPNKDPNNLSKKIEEPKLNKKLEATNKFTKE